MPFTVVDLELVWHVEAELVIDAELIVAACRLLMKLNSDSIQKLMVFPLGTWLCFALIRPRHVRIDLIAGTQMYQVSNELSEVCWSSSNLALNCLNKRTLEKGHPGC